jgi:predicted enzyme related to lactoylglutathione lyase
MTRSLAVTAVAVLVSVGGARLSLLPGITPATVHAATATPKVAVGPQYATTHVYVTPENFDHFVASLLATLGGTTSKQGVITVTPTPSSTMQQLVFTPVGIVSVFGFKTPVPYPFGVERTGYLVTDMDAAIRAARVTGADVLVTPFTDPIGRDAIIQWPGGVVTQLYWHTTAPSYTPLRTIPENRIYVSSDSVAAFIRSFLALSLGNVVSDTAHAPGLEIGRPTDTYRRIRIHSNFGSLALLVTDGHLPYPYGRETTGYEVADLAETLAKARAAGVAILVAPYTADQRTSALVQFPGGYIAEIHSPVSKPSASGPGLGAFAPARASHVEDRPPDRPERWHASNTSERIDNR